MPVYTLLYIPTILSDYPKMTKNETKLEQKHLRHPPPYHTRTKCCNYGQMRMS